MAFLTKIVVAATAFAALTAARPLAIRDVTSVVTETDYTTVNVPVTLWVDEGGKPLSTVADGGVLAASATPAVEQSKVEISASPSTPHSVSVVPTTTPAPLAQVVPTTTSAPQLQAQAQAYTTPAAVSSPEPVASSPSAITSSSSSVSSPAATTTASAAQTNTASSGQASVCTPGAPCSGDITHWEGGLGACGWDVDSDNSMQIAMPVGMMGSLSNSNPYCGMSVTVKNPTTGTEVVAKVGDKCMGCTGGSIDLTNALFAAVGNNCDGRCSGFEWWFN